MSQRSGDWIQTFTGRRFWPLDPRPEEVEVEDIARALSRLCRFTGHTREFYSVAQHSCLVADFLDRKWRDKALAFEGLIHDAAEAYLGDISRPLKGFLYLDLPFVMRDQQIGEAEDLLLAVIRRALGATAPELSRRALVKQADEVLLATEARDLMSPLDPDWAKWLDGIEAMPDPIDPWSPNRAFTEFMDRFVALSPRPIGREAVPEFRPAL